MRETIKNRYDLDDRTVGFAKSIVCLCKKLPRDMVNFKLIDRVIRSAVSIGSNCRRASDSFEDREFIYKIRTARDGSKEAIFWLELLYEGNQDLRTEIDPLISECIELKQILSSIVRKLEIKNSRVVHHTG